MLDSLPQIRLAFVGSGPYPITALLVAERYPGAQLITCVDNNVVAFLLGRAVIAALGLPIDSVFAEATDVDYGPFNVVVIAAMVRDKNDLVTQILCTSDAMVIARGTTHAAHERLIQMDAAFRDDGGMGR